MVKYEFPLREIHGDRLELELAAHGVRPVTVYVNGTSVVAVYPEELSEEQHQTMYATVLTHRPPPPAPLVHRSREEREAVLDRMIEWFEEHRDD